MSESNIKALVVRSYFGKKDGEHIEEIVPFVDTPENRQAVVDKWLDKDGYSRHHLKEPFLAGKSNQVEASETDHDWDDPNHYVLTIYTKHELLDVFNIQHQRNMATYQSIFEPHDT